MGILEILGRGIYATWAVFGQAILGVVFTELMFFGAFLVMFRDTPEVARPVGQMFLLATLLIITIVVVTAGCLTLAAYLNYP